MEYEQETRMAGDYRIILATQIARTEVVVGENPAAEPGQRYLVAYCETLDIFTRYTDCLVSDDYAETMEIYGQRIVDKAREAAQELQRYTEEGIDLTPFRAEDCAPIDYDESLENRIVVIKPEILRREYAHSVYQLKLCDGGFGASGNSRGRACYCIDLYTGKTSRYNRSDILGTLEPEQLPDWARKKYAELAPTEKTNAEREAR